MTTEDSALALTLVWIGRLKFEDYEVDNIRPLVTSSGRPRFGLSTGYGQDKPEAGSMAPKGQEEHTVGGSA